MRKTLFSALLFSALAGTAFKCDHWHEHDENPIVQTINKTIAPGASFTVALPGDADDVYAKTLAPAHASADAISGQNYAYTAAAGYTGDDKVVLQSTEQHQGHGRCGNHNGEVEATVTINIHILASGDSTATN